jgi:lactate permease
MHIWSQSYDPLGNIYASAVIAAIPALLILVLIAGFNVRIHLAALISLGTCLILATCLYHMPVTYATASAVYGASYGLFPIGWLVLNIIFVYQLTVRRGLFDVLRRSLAQIAPDPRIQIILIAFGFGSFLEGLSGFGAPVAITAAILMQLGFRPLHASGLALVANTAPVAFGSLGIPLTTLQQVTDLDVRALSATVGALLVVFSFFIPFLIVIMLSGWRGLAGIWPAALVAGLSYTVPQYLLATYHGPWLAAPVAGLCCIASLVLLLRFWCPATPWQFDENHKLAPTTKIVQSIEQTDSRRRIFDAWLPWGLLTILILIWGIPQVQTLLEGRVGQTQSLSKLVAADFNMPFLHQLIRRMPPVESENAKPIAAIFKFHVLKETGTGIFFASILIGLVTGYSPREWFKTYLQTIWHIRLSLLTIATMLAIGNVIRYSGIDGTLGLAFAHTGRCYPFFGTLLGWIGAAITGSDTSVNVLFGSLQKITAQQLGISAILMCAANTCGGVMGKMISSQSIVVASTATNWYGHEGRILRYVFLPSIILAALMGILVCLAAYFGPFAMWIKR